MKYIKQINYAKLSIIVIVIAAILRFAFAISHTVSGDACWHLSNARFIATNDKLPLFEGLGRDQPFWAPPIFHLFAAFFYKIFSIVSFDAAELSLKLVSPIFGTLTIIVAYLITKRLFEQRITFYSMLFLNFVPLFMDYSILSYVDSTLAFFSVLSVYLILERKYVLSSIAFGIAILSKYNAIFMLPMLVYLAYKQSKNKRELYKSISLTIFLPLLISSFWFVRNFILLGNPFWPYLNGIFHGVDIGTSFNELNLYNILSYTNYLSFYFELFGVPNGNIALIYFLEIPYIKQLLFIWIIGTIIFIFPLVKWLLYKNKSKEKRYFLISIYILFIAFLLMLFTYLINTRWFSSRLLLPIIPFMAIIWAKGIDSIKRKNIYLIVVLITSAGFIAAEVAKFYIASKEWDIYAKDFEWVKSNSNKEDLFYGNGQCLSYKINRVVVPHTIYIDFNEVDYVWVNDKWRIDFHMDEKSLSRVKNSNLLKVVYNNQDSGTIIYETSNK